MPAKNCPVFSTKIGSKTDQAHFLAVPHTDHLFHCHGPPDPSNAIIASQVAPELPTLTPPRPGTSSSARSTPRSSNRRSNITSQLYQFALGFPQTPPEDSPEVDPIALHLESSPPSTANAGAMGSFLFKWDHPALEVYVTGTFDDWAKTVKLEKKGAGFEKLLNLPATEHKIYYKFVVDGDWTTDHTAPQEDDGANNVNNVLTPDRVSKSQLSSQSTSHIMSGVTPQSTTAQLAGQVPKESERDQNANSGSPDLPGSFPETPGPNEASEFGVNPIPATSGMGNPVNLQAGEQVPDPSTLTDNTVSSTARDDPSLSRSAEDSEKTFGVAPLPATAGIGNPIHLQPGEKVPDPSTFTNNTVQSTVRNDTESYEKGPSVPQLPNVVTPPSEREAQGGMFNLPGISKNMIPESSLPMGGNTSAEKDPGFTTQSAGADSTTAALAANVPLEPRGVPQVVQDSQQEAGSGPEASGYREAVKEKSAMEKELESKVPEEPPTSEGKGAASAGTSSLPSSGLGGAALATSSPPSHGLPPSIQRSINEMNAGSGGAIAPAVPDVVQESITESHQSPEAAGDEGMVQEKKQVETELLKGTQPEQSAGEPAPTASTALAESAPAATSSSAQPDTTSPTQPRTTAAASTQPAASSIPDPRSTTTDTAAAASEPPVSTSANAPATTLAADKATKEGIDSRDVSPMTRPAGSDQAQPIVTSGVGSGAAPQTSKPTSSKPESSKPAPSPSSGTDKKDKRRSGFFGKLKQKFGDKK